MKNGKHLIAIALMFGAFMLTAQDSKTIQAKKFKFVKVARDTKKEVKKLEKEGWTNIPGDMPVGQQLNNAWAKEAELDGEGFPKYIVANGESGGEFQSAAEMQAIELAKLNLVGLLETQMRSVIETEQGNNRLDAKTAASLSKTLQVATNKVSKKLKRVIPISKLMRKKGKQTEIQVKLAYSYALAQQAIIDEMKEEMKVETEEMRTKYDAFLNPEIYKQGEIKNSAGETPAAK
jgi:hypothetical protein